MRVWLAVMAALALTINVARAQEAEVAPDKPPAPEDQAAAPQGQPPESALDWDTDHPPGATIPPAVMARLQPRIDAIRARGRIFQPAGVAPTLAQTIAPGDVILAIPVRHVRAGILEGDLVQPGAFGRPERTLLHANTPMFHADLPSPESEDAFRPTMLSLWCGSVRRDRDWETYCLDGTRRVYRAIESNAYYPKRLNSAFNMRSNPPTVRETPWEESGLPTLEMVTIFTGWAGADRTNVQRGFRIDGNALDVHDTYYSRRPNGDSLMRFGGGLVLVHPNGTGGTVEIVKPMQDYDPDEDANLMLRVMEILYGARR